MQKSSQNPDLASLNKSSWKHVRYYVNYEHAFLFKNWSQNPDFAYEFFCSLKKTAGELSQGYNFSLAFMMW